MQIKLQIIDEPGTGLCTVADLTGDGQEAKILISTYCANNYVSEELYNRIEHESPQFCPKISLDVAAYYLNDLEGAKAGVVKFLRLPGHTLTDVPVIVTKGFPAYRCDMILGTPIVFGYRSFIVDPDAGVVTITDEKIEWQKNNTLAIF